jgi:tRNA 2-thiocytidine biosynthesis protein TtcA
MSYRSRLEARIAKKTTRAITDFNLIEDGDRVMVGLSGGKDSWALLQTLDILRQRAPIRFSLIAVNVDSGYKDFKHDLIAKTCTRAGLGIPHRAHGDRGGDGRSARGQRHALLALRPAPARRALPNREGGGRHEDCAGASPRRLHRDAAAQPVLRRGTQSDAGPLVSDNAEHVVIRPLAYVGEDEARLYAKECGFRSSAAAARRAATSACSASA